MSTTAMMTRQSSKPAAGTLATLYRNRRLLWQFTVRNVELRHKGSQLGLIWSFLNPLLMLGVYVFVFGFVFPGRFQPKHAEPRIEYALVAFLGLAMYHFVAEIIATSPQLIVGNPNFVKKVVFPLEILPLSAVGGALFHFVITLALVFVGALIAGVPITGGVIWLPIIMLPLVAMAIGAAMALSAVGVFWRDVFQVTQFFLLILMFASAVFYPVTQIPAAVWTFLRFNPFIHVINESRSVVFWGLPPNFVHIGYLYGCGVLSLLIGFTLFQRLRPSFADVL
jgi:lipopolysaccharide transport system permease protein